MKKRFFILSLMLAIPCLAGCNNTPNSSSSSSSQSKNPLKVVSFDYKFNDTNMATDHITSDELHFEFDYKEFFDTEPTTYNKKIAEFCNLASSDIAPLARLYFKLDDGTYPETREECEIYKYYDLKDVIYYQQEPIYYKDDLSDLTNILVGHLEFDNYNNQKEQLIFVTYEATPLDLEQISQTISNFDFGVDSPNYVNSDYPHTEWTNKHEHKGFSIATNRSEDSLEIYLSRYLKSDYRTTFVVTGHSRGGACANILAKRLIDKNYRTFTYTFGCPGTTDDKESAENPNYKSIFNFKTEHDLISQVPPKEMGFYCYGTTLLFDDLALKDKWSALYPNAKYHYDSDLPGLIDEALTVIKDRTHAYSPDYDTPLENERIEYTLKLSADLERNKYVEFIQDNELNSHLVKISEVSYDSSNNQYYFYVQAAPMFLLEIFKFVLEHPLTAALYAKTLLKFTVRFSDLAVSLVGRVLLNGLPAYAVPHLIPTYYVCVKNSEE